MLSFKTVVDLPTLGIIFNEVKSLDRYYPDFNNWYYDTLVPDIILGRSKAIIMEKHGELVGVSLLKDTDEEKKIRALRINPKFTNRGLGLYLIDESLKLLDTDRPKVTVAEELIHDYSRIFINRYDFNISKVDKGIYRKSKLEYIFN